MQFATDVAVRVFTFGWCAAFIILLSGEPITLESAAIITIGGLLLADTIFVFGFMNRDISKS